MDPVKQMRCLPAAAGSPAAPLPALPGSRWPRASCTDDIVINRKTRTLLSGFCEQTPDGTLSDLHHDLQRAQQNSELYPAAQTQQENALHLTAAAALSHSWVCAGGAAGSAMPASVRRSTAAAAAAISSPRPACASALSPCCWPLGCTAARASASRCCCCASARTSASCRRRTSRRCERAACR